MSSPLSSVTSVFGKAPAAADFLSLEVGSQGAQSLRTWLHAAFEESRAVQPPAPVCFVIRPPQSAQWVAGALSPSRDAVKREFPLVVCAPVDPDVLTAPFSTVPHMLGDFFLAAQELVITPWEDLERLRSVMRAVPAPRGRDQAALQQSVAQATASVSADAWWSARLGEERAPRSYAMYVLREAVRACSRDEAFPEARLVVVCPAETSLDLFVWLEMVSRMLGPWHACPSFVWSASLSRLWVTLGSPPRSLLACLGAEGELPPTAWPVTTRDPRGLELAERELPPGEADVANHAGTLAEMLECVERVS